MKAPALARRYAQALLVASDPTLWQSLLEGLHTLAFCWSNEPDFRSALADPGLDAAPKLKLALGLMKHPPQSLGRLLEMIIKRHRLALLPELAVAFEEVAAAAQGKRLVEISSPQPLNEAECAHLQQALERYFGAPVVMRTSVEPGLLGGIKLTRQGQVIDGSLQAALVQLADRLRHAPAQVE